jgi:hypothetical protein
MRDRDLSGEDSVPLRTRLIDRARVAREQARLSEDGAERERLLDYANQCETAVGIADVLDRPRSEVVLPSDKERLEMLASLKRSSPAPRNRK